MNCDALAKCFVDRFAEGVIEAGLPSQDQGKTVDGIIAVIHEHLDVIKKTSAQVLCFINGKEQGLAFFLIQVINLLLNGAEHTGFSAFVGHPEDGTELLVEISSTDCGQADSTNDQAPIRFVLISFIFDIMFLNTVSFIISYIEQNVDIISNIDYTIFKQDYMKGADTSMTLQEAETKLSELSAEINKLLQDREAVLKEWNLAFYTENQDNIICIDENIGDVHKLYLVNGESKMFICHLDNYDMNGSLQDFYKHIDNSMHIHNIANGRDFEIPDYQKNLVYAKAIEIRESL